MCQLSLAERDFGGTRPDELVLPALGWVTQSGAREAARNGVAHARPSKQPRREQVTHSAGSPWTQRDAARHQTGLPQHPLADRMALTVVRVEHVISSTREHRIQFPC